MGLPMNLHFMLDEKVVTRAIQNFELAMPGQNKYVIVVPTDDYAPQHVKIQNDNVYFAKYNSKKFKDAVGDVSQYKNIIIHLLTNSMVDFVLHHKHPAYTWMVWGGDLYNDLLQYVGFPIYYDKWAIRKARGKNILLYKLVSPLIFIYHKYRVRWRIRAIKNMSYVCGDKYDIKKLKYYIPQLSHLRFKHVIAYYQVEQILAETFCKGNNIVVGNSAYAAGNHVEVFRELAKLDIGNRKVIVPLSYGDVADYIIEEGRKILGDNFYPVTDFLPLKEYNELLLSANTFIYGNYRQAAAGNIIVGLYSGGTVFLNERNSLYETFKEKGCVIYPISSLKERIDYRLTQGEIEKNRHSITQNRTIEDVIESIKNAFS